MCVANHIRVNGFEGAARIGSLVKYSGDRAAGTTYVPAAAHCIL